MLLHLIGVAVGFADLLRGSRRFTDGAGKVRMQCGVQSSDESSLPTSGGGSRRA